MVEKKVAVRSQDPGQRRILDRATRQRRLNRQLEALENDNFQDDPHANLPQLVKRLPQFDDDAETGAPGAPRAAGTPGFAPGTWEGRGGWEEEEEDPGRSLQTPLPEKLPGAAGGAEPEHRRGPQLPDGLCGPLQPAPAPFLHRLRPPLPLHLRQLRGPLLLRALPLHPPGDPVPEVDGLALPGILDLHPNLWGP
ncbi:zinc finger HIT domain-containing protein 1 isoform X1 [Eretmochelys imbricata]